MTKQWQWRRDRNISVLLVEDNAADSRLVREWLSEIHQGGVFTITQAGCIADALEKLYKFSFDVVLLDLDLPDSFGLTTFGHIQTADPHLPVVILSGQSDEDLAMEAVKIGAQDYLVKGQGDGNLLSRALYYAIERKQSEEHLAYLAQFDPLTDLPNRVLFRDRLVCAMQHAERRGNMVGLIFLDLDHFKDINDNFGHDAGDTLLKQVAHRLKCCVRAEDTVARMGGDEFTIILSAIQKKEQAAMVAEKIIDAMDRLFMLDGKALCVGASLGIATHSVSTGGDENALIKHADMALYCAKAKGRGSYQFYEQALKESVSRRMSIIEQLRQAVKKDQFQLFYQPLLDAKNLAVFGMQALLRWQHPYEGLMVPSQFVFLLEETGLIHQAGDWVLRTACRQNQNWITSGMPALPVSVNISRRQIQHNRLDRTVQQVLEETGLEPRYLKLEISESAVMGDSAHTESILWALHRMGVGIVLDGFGGEFLSLKHMKRLPIQSVKIDRGFVQDGAEQDMHDDVLEAMIGLGRSLRYKVHAKGVETPAQCTFLKNRGCDVIQGHWFGEPMPEASYAKWLQSQRNRNHATVV